MEKIDFSTYEKGKYELDGSNIKANVNIYATQPVADRRAEKHNQYIDIQIILSGEEKIGYVDYKPDFTVTEDKMAEKDIAFYKVTGENFITLKAGDFAVLFPWEVHRPNCQSGDKPCQMKKVILKVKMS
jgi:biofilm protein TabA